MTQREKFEKWFNDYGKDIELNDTYKELMFVSYKAAKLTSFTLPDRMDYDLEGVAVIDSHHNTFADGYNQCLTDVISMNEEYANSTVSDGWIPVSERLPDDYSMSICVGHGGYQFICRKEPNGWFRFPQMKKLDGVTHWMPLPSAPDGDK